MAQMGGWGEFPPILMVGIIMTKPCVGEQCFPSLPIIQRFTISSVDHIHRQNCLEDYEMKLAVQKLQKIDNSGLQDM